MKTLKSFGTPSKTDLRITFGDTHFERADALARAFAGVNEVEVVEGNLLNLDCEAIVSPANSFGDMGGGIDKAIDDFHEGKAQAAVVVAMAEHWFGELPVGSALVVTLATRRWPFIVVAPTMRIPGNVASTINAYLAMRAALMAVLKHNANSDRPIRHLAVSSLCTGVGGMPHELSAEQMRTAYDSVIGGEWRKVLHPALAPYAFPGKRIAWTEVKRP